MSAIDMGRRLGTPFDQFCRGPLPRPARPWPTPAEQRAEAGCRSAVVRRARADALTGLRRAGSCGAGLDMVAGIVETSPEWAAAIDVHELLGEIPSLTADRADEMQCAAGLYRAVTVGELEPLTRAVFVAVVRYWATSVTGEAQAA